ncbi:MAG: hypothetical protein R6U29_10830, partial [Desulfosudaceae bacterium]
MISYIQDLARRLNCKLINHKDDVFVKSPNWDGKVKSSRSRRTVFRGIESRRWRDDMTGNKVQRSRPPWAIVLFTKPSKMDRPGMDRPGKTF